MQLMAEARIEVTVQKSVHRIFVKSGVIEPLIYDNQYNQYNHIVLTQSTRQNLLILFGHISLIDLSVL